MSWIHLVFHSGSRLQQGLQVLRQQLARLVVIAISPRFVEAAVVEPQLKPNQQNQRINTPRAAMERLCPGIARAFPSLSYFPIRGPRILAPTSAQIPPTIWTGCGTCKIVESHLSEPSTAPDPVAGYRVNKNTDCCTI